MNGFLVHLLRRHPWTTAALGVALCALAFFAWQLVDGTRRAARPPEPALEAWMSPRFVARSWNLPRETIEELMEIEPDAGRETRPRTLADVLERTGLTLEELQRRVELADEEDRLRRGRRDGDEAGR